jgi:hypothetical protein
MLKQLSELLANQSVDLSVQVTNKRLKRGGIMLEKDLQLQRKSSGPQSPFRSFVTKKLAGG